MAEMIEKLIVESVGMICGNYRNEQSLLIYFLTSNCEGAVKNEGINKFFSICANF